MSKVKKTKGVIGYGVVDRETGQFAHYLDTQTGMVIFGSKRKALINYNYKFSLYKIVKIKITPIPKNKKTK